MDTVLATVIQAENDLVAFQEAIPELVKSLRLYAKNTRPVTEFKVEDAYPNYQNNRIIGSTELVAKMDIASAVIRQPVVVFRDFLKSETTNEQTYIETYIGIIRRNNGTPAIVSVRTHRNLIISTTVKDPEKSDEIFSKISGVIVHKKGF